MQTTHPAAATLSPQAVLSSQMRTVLYFGTLALFSIAMLGSGIMDIQLPPEMAEGMRHVGLADPLTRLLGAWKLLGVAALVVPGFPRLKEWAYAGFFFDLSGAVVAHLAAGDGPIKATVPLILLAVGAASWALRPQSRRI